MRWLRGHTDPWAAATAAAAPDHRLSTILLDAESAPREHPLIKDDVLAAIISCWGDTPADKLARNDPIDIAHDLQFYLSDADGYDNDKRNEIARELIAWIKSLLPNEFPAEPQPPTAATPAAPTGQPDAEAAAEAELRRMAIPVLMVGAAAGSARKEVCLRLRVSGAAADVRKVIVLDGGDVSGPAAEAHVFCPFGVTVECTGAAAQLRQQRKSYVELLQIARTF